MSKLIIVSLSFLLLGLMQRTCRSNGFPPANQFVLEDVEVDYLVPNASHSFGHLVIVPEMRFECHGYITGWSALTQLDSTEAVLDNLNHDITFQLWRPSARGSGIYEIVWSKTLGFISDTLRAGLFTENGIQFFNFTSNDERLYFQPGDVIGWYIHTLVQSTERPLTIVYRQPSSSNRPGLQPVDMYTAMIEDTRRADTPPPCEVSLCSGRLTVIPSVIPYVTVDYGEQKHRFILDTKRRGC